MSKRIMITLVVLVVLAIGSYYGYNSYTAGQATPTPDTAALEDLQSTIWASGKIVPAQWALLSASVGGQVVEMVVEEGQPVNAGDVLLKLDDLDGQAAVSNAEASLAVAQAQLASVQAKPRLVEIAIAEDNVRLAEAQVMNAVALVAQAEAGVTSAQTQVDRALADLQQLKVGPTPSQRIAGLAPVKEAENALAVAQAEYDKIAWAGEVGLSPQALTLQSATLHYQTVQAEYQTLLTGATAPELAAAQAMVAGAKAAVTQAEAALQGAEAGVVQAQAAAQAAAHQRDLVVAGTTRPEDVAVAKAAVQQAQSAWQTAQNALTKTVIRAPFSSTVGTIHVRLGEQVLPGQTLITLGNLDRLRVETTDLRETDVSRVSVGQPVDLTFDALPNVLLTGRIARISLQATSGQGGTNYTTIIDFDTPPTPPALRWGMTVFVNITVK